MCRAPFGEAAAAAVRHRRRERWRRAARHVARLPPLEREEDQALTTQAIYKFKEVLHANDPAYGIFTKAWGKPVADAFFYLETHHHPALPMPDEA